MSKEEIEEKEDEREDESEYEETSKEKKGRIKLPMKAILFLVKVLIVFGGIAFLTVSYVRRNPEPFGLMKGPALMKNEEKELVAEISKSLTLPEDEEPTVATVTDPEKLTDQFFFKDVEKGDRLLIYQNARKVILYRPSEKRVVEVGVVSVKQGENAQISTSYKLVILNSTKDANIVSSLEYKLSEIDKNVSVTEKNSSVLTYNESFLVDVKGDKKDLASKLASGFAVKEGTMPDAEREYDADFILVIGADKIR